jgi:glutaminyl-tRNA synthetase
MTKDNAIKFMHLKENVNVTGSVYIHNSAFSPPGNFHFRLNSDKVTYLITEASSYDIPNKIISLFVIISDKAKIEDLTPFYKLICKQVTINRMATDNKKLYDPLESIYSDLRSLISDDPSEVLTKYKGLFVTLADEYDSLRKESAELIIKNILNGNIDSKVRLVEGIRYLKSNEFDLNSFNTAIGLGISFSDEEIESEVRKAVGNLPKCSWLDWANVIKTVNASMKWASQKTIKDKTDIVFNELFGPKPVINKQSFKQKVSVFDTFELYKPEENHTNRPEKLAEHLKVTGGKVITRFPPEPNGYLHIGHCKAMFINFGYAAKKDGLCYMRFDDTNPETEEQEYIDAILEDVQWLGYKIYKVTYASDYFDELIGFAFDLIKMDKAFVCELATEQLRKDRINAIESPYRNRPIDESLDLFKRMIDGEFKPGRYTLRLKMDSSSDNPNMRDPVAYRILETPHPRTGTKYRVYPSYDYSHCIVDSIENITHSLCTMEFQTRNECYQWILEALDLYRPNQIEYSRLSMTHVMLSKRKLIKLVSSKVVDGWDDPRMPTIKGLRRRGYTKESIAMFCNEIGVNIGGATGHVNYDRLETCIRKDLDTKAPRRMAIMDPLRITIVNWSESTPNVYIAKDFPSLGANSATRQIKMSSDIVIDASDFRTDPDENFFRLRIGGVVRLKYAFPIKCIGNKIGSDGRIIGLYAEILYDYTDKIRGTISWLPVDDLISVEIREYSHLFPENMPVDDDWMKYINKDSKRTFNALTESSLANASVGDRYQFERFGYYIVDKDSNEDRLVFNKIVDLKEAKDK